VAFGRRRFLEAVAAAAGGLALAAMPARTAPGPVDAILAHHERTKHRPGRPARAPERVEWSGQPDPFRRFHGARLLPLDEVPPTPEPTWDAVLGAGLPPRPVDRASISQLLYDALALSAWKEQGDARWSLRVNPSSGNLHPTEAYLVGGPFPGLTGAPALLHYAPHEHALESRAALPERTWRALAADLPPGAFLAALTSIHWREAWKYGERGWRYCLLDAGHAAAALSIAAAALGWRALVLAWPDRDVARLTGVERQSGPGAERPELLLAVGPEATDWPARGSRSTGLPPVVRDALGALPLDGRPNRLGAGYRSWPAVEEAVAAAERTGSARPPRASARASVPRLADRRLPARALVRGRRTALGFDPSVSLERGDLLAALERTLPASARAVSDLLPWPTSVHLALLVHRVDGLAPGLYLLPRGEGGAADLEDAASALARAGPVEGASSSIPLLRLSAADLRAAARAACCDQDTAADGAFTAAMLARLEPTLRDEGAWAYRRLHWEAAALGHALYLEAEAMGLGATAMGCYLDDELHRLLGLRDRRFQVLYTIAVGRRVDDPRLRTSEPYRHLG
jgi:SagB-type dehydrogenase family enzyme